MHWAPLGFFSILIRARPVKIFCQWLGLGLLYDRGEGGNKKGASQAPSRLDVAGDILNCRLKAHPGSANLPDVCLELCLTPKGLCFLRIVHLSLTAHFFFGRNRISFWRMEKDRSCCCLASVKQNKTEGALKLFICLHNHSDEMSLKGAFLQLKVHSKASQGLSPEALFEIFRSANHGLCPFLLCIKCRILSSESGKKKHSKM